MSIFHTLKSLFWALLLLVLIVYVFATLPLARQACIFAKFSGVLPDIGPKTSARAPSTALAHTSPTDASLLKRAKVCLRSQ